MYCAGQDDDLRVWAYSGLAKRGSGQWLVYDKDDKQLEMVCVGTYKRASDHSTAIITREMWQAERDKLKGEKKVSKPNKEGWIRHRGGKCPVDNLAMIEVRNRDGSVHLLHGNDVENTDETWLHVGDNDDIMAYRYVKVALADAARSGNDSESKESFTPGRQVLVTDDPRTMRDRIHEIDAASKEEESRHCAAMEAFDKERAELVAKLAAEGLALVERPADVVEDMDDRKNWAPGDIVVCLEDEYGEFSAGTTYEIDYMEANWCNVTADDRGDKNAMDPIYFRWHSRPTN